MKTTRGMCYRRTGPLTAAQRDLAAEWWPYAVRVASNAARSKDECWIADCAVDGILSAVRYWNPDRPGGCKDFRVWLAWITRAAVRHARGARMRTGHGRFLADLVPLPPNITVESNPPWLDVREECDRLRRNLHPKQAEVVYRIYDLGETPTEAAEAMGVSVGAVSHNHRAAMARMRRNEKIKS